MSSAIDVCLVAVRDVPAIPACSVPCRVEYRTPRPDAIRVYREFAALPAEIRHFFPGHPHAAQAAKAVARSVESCHESVAARGQARGGRSIKHHKIPADLVCPPRKSRKNLQKTALHVIDFRISPQLTTRQ